MIVLDTHIWVWWVHGDTSLTNNQVAWLQHYETQGLGVSAVSCWEIAKLVEYNKSAASFRNPNQTQTTIPNRTTANGKPVAGVATNGVNNQRTGV